MRKLAILVLLGSLAPAQAGEEAAWVGAMREVHAKFKGAKGTFAHFGDSITITRAFWHPLKYGKKKNMSPGMQKAFELVEAYMKPECWSGWKGARYGNQGSMTIRWAHAHVDEWIKNLNPECALIMFGTNDLHALKADEYERKTRDVVQKCLENGTLVILSTIPPRHGFLEKSRKFAAIVRKIAADFKVPLCDFFAEVLKRRPKDWDGKLEKFKAHKGYEVLTLVAGDGVHPSNPKEYVNDFSEKSLKTNGFSLRNYLTLMSYAEVIRKVFPPSRPQR